MIGPTGTVWIEAGLMVALLSQLLWIAWHDWRHMKVTNRSLLPLLVLYILFGLLSGFDMLLSDLGAGAMLFVMSFLLWRFGLMGAGDVKLYFFLGLFMGFVGLPFFATLLLILSLLMTLALYAAAALKAEHGISGRLAEMKASGRLPYAVLMVASSAPVILARYVLDLP